MTEFFSLLKFFRDLRTLKDKPWYIDKLFHNIRIPHQIGDRTTVLCPLTAVCVYVKNKDITDNADTEKIMKVLKLSERTVYRVMWGEDNFSCDKSEKIRRLIIKILELNKDQ